MADHSKDTNTQGWLSLSEWWPIPRACGFIHASLDDTLHSLTDWKTPLVADYGATLRVHEIKGTIDDAFKALLPLRSPQPNKYLLLPTASGEWTAVFNNDFRGTEPHSLVFVMNRHYGHDSIEAIDIPHTLSKDKLHGYYGCTAFIYQYSKGKERWVRNMRTHQGWEFGTVGDPLPFEDISLFNQPHAKDRFDHDTLLRYLAAMGIDVSDKAFYMPEGRAVIIEEHEQDFGSDVEIKTWSLTDARKR